MILIAPPRHCQYHIIDKYYRIDTHGLDSVGGRNFVCDATCVLLGEQTCAEACPESATSHMISAF
jgi:hypothetical protein